MRTAVIFAAAVLLLGSSGCRTLKARKLANEAAGHYKDGDLRGAAALYEQAVGLDPKLATIHLNLGFAYLSIFTASPKSKEGNEAGGKALIQFQRYIDLRPKDERGRQYLVQTFVDTNRYTDAVAYFKPEIERPQPSLEAIKTLGIIAKNTGRIDDALKWYQRRVELLPNDPDAHYSLGVLMWDYLHNHQEVVAEQRVQYADNGIASLKKAIELRPHGFEAYTYTNLLYRERSIGAPDDIKKQEDLTEAEKYLKESLRLIKEQGGLKAVTSAASGAK